MFSRLFRRKEGEVRPGPYPVDGGWLPAGAPLNWWQLGMDVSAGSGRTAMVEACVSAYSQTVAMCPGDHWRRRADGGRDRVTNSALTKIIRAPNDYQSISDFLLNLTRELYQTGAAYALAVRDRDFNIVELHLMQSRASSPLVSVDGEVFYDLSGNDIVDRRFGQVRVPARDVLHVRLHTPRNILIGESPLVAAALDIAATNAALQQQVQFLVNQAKPSIMLSTDSVLTREQVTELRARWNEQTRGDGAGGTPILTGGLKPQTVSMSAVDAQVAELLKMSAQNIALAYRIPLQILGIGGAPMGSTEALMQSWVATGLGFALNHIEEAFGRLFRLDGFPDEYVEFSTKALLRSSFRDRIEALARSTISGIHSPDEARNEEDLPKVPGGAGAEPRVQQQVVPLSAWEKGQVADPAPPALPPPDDTAKAIAALRMKFTEAAIVH